jgi:hypothetical protein
MREYRFGGTATTAYRAFTVVVSDTTVTPSAVTPPALPCPSMPLQRRVRTGLERMTSSPRSAAMRSETDCMPPTTRRSRMKSSSTRLEKDPAVAAMRIACSAEKECAGLVSMPPAMKSPMLSQASSSSDCCRSQWWKEMVSRARASGWFHGASGPASATSRSRMSMSRVISSRV